LNLHQYLDDLSNMQINKNTRIILLVLYALIMFSTIMSEINTLIFIVLFVIVPISVYAFVKIIFPKT
jgi:hypothetical protein